MRRKGSIGALLAVLALGGCSSPDGASVIRWIEDEPDEFLEATTLFELEPVFSWRFATASDLAGFESRNIDRTFAVESGELVVRSSSSDPYFFRAVELRADTVHAIRIVLAEEATVEPHVYWAGPDQEFSEKRSVRLEAPGERTKEYLVDVGRHSGWAGEIGFLRIDPSSKARQTVRIREIVGLRKVFRRDRLEAALGDAWRLDLDSEVRSILLSPPAHRLEKDVTIPPEGELRFAYGLLREVAGASARKTRIAFRASLALEGERPRVLFEEEMDPGHEAEASDWQEAVVDLAGFARRKGRIVLETRAEGSPDFLHGLPVWANPEIVRKRFRGEDRPNVLLISIDTLRADHLSLYGYGRETSPHIDAWARRTGVTFENAVAPSPWTLPSHVSLFTGLNATRHGVNFGDPAPPSLTTLAEVLRRAGYTTAAVTGGGYLAPDFGLTQGFDRYASTNSILRFGDREIRVGVGRASAFIRQNKGRPFFLFFHTYEVHSPYRPRLPFFDRWSPGDALIKSPDLNLDFITPHEDDGFRTRHRLVWAGTGPDGKRPITRDDVPTAIDMYDSGIAYADREIGRLLRELEKAGIEGNTLVVLTSDHGERLGENGYFGHDDLSEENLIVPLVFSLPGRLPGGRRIPTQVRSVDVPATILDLVGEQVPQAIDGVSLVGLWEGGGGGFPEEAWSYGPITNAGISLRIGNQTKYVFSNTAGGGAHGEEELYRLGENRGRARNVAAEASPEELRGLRERVEAELGRVPGLRIQFTNEGAGVLRGVVRPVSIPVVKALQLPCRCLRWKSPARLHFRIPGGTSVTALIEGSRNGALEIEASAGKREPRLSVALEPGRLREPWAAARTGSGWKEGRPQDVEGSTAIRVWWEGDAPLGGSPQADPDPDVVRQLRALGYVQ